MNIIQSYVIYVNLSRGKAPRKKNEVINKNLFLSILSERYVAYDHFNVHSILLTSYAALTCRSATAPKLMMNDVPTADREYA